MRRLIPLLILVVGLASVIVVFAPNLTLPSGRPADLKFGLDLEGGLRVEYQAQPVQGKSPSRADMQVIRDIVEKRVNGAGVSEPVVVTQGSDRVVVELPGVDNPQEIRRLVGSTGKLEFVPIPPGTQIAANQPIDLTTYPPLFGGEELSSAVVGSDQFGRPAVDFTLKSDAAAKFAKYTTENVGNQFAIVLDNVVISAPVIQSPITGGSGQITGGSGGFTASEAKNLVTILQYGALPFPIQEVSVEAVAPTLGEQFLQQGFLAALVGIGLVLLLMLVHYRLPGAVASLALIYYTILVLAIFILIPVTLTLAGIAGFVLSIGMAVDANILIFERMKEELRAGKTLVAAIESGFNRAWNSILDSNVSSLITAGILFWFGSSVIRGFALVLIIGVLCSMFTAVTVSRTVLRWVVRQPRFRRATLYGVTEDEFSGQAVTRPVSRREARGRA